jgi:hypothetical protein
LIQKSPGTCKKDPPGKPGLHFGGGVGIRVLWIVASLFVIAGAVLWLVNNQQKNEERFFRKALEISDYGLMAVMQKLGEMPSWVGDCPKTPYEDGWYTAKVSRYTGGDTVFLRVESVGHIGPVLKKQQCVLRLSIVKGDSAWIRTSAD